jgi:hypothetical protein
MSSISLKYIIHVSLQYYDLQIVKNNLIGT